jgi:DNA polymerase elongation subunit (family B)
VPLVRRGLVYAEFSGAVWRVAEPARRWEPLRAKLVSKGYKVAQSYIPRSVRSYLEGVRRLELGGRGRRSLRRRRRVEVEHGGRSVGWVARLRGTWRIGDSGRVAEASWWT